MINNIGRKRVKIVLALIAAFLVMSTLTGSVFVNNTFQVNQNFITQIKNKLENGKEKVSVFFAKVFNKQSNIPVSDERLQKLYALTATKLVPGVYARKDSSYEVIDLVDSEVNWIQYTFVVNGKEIVINIPEGQSPPPQEVIDRMYGD
jgi:uncharacterized membrane-anchored protein YhcB (DUF1043 family)